MFSEKKNYDLKIGSEDGCKIKLILVSLNHTTFDQLELSKCQKFYLIKSDR